MKNIKFPITHQQINTFSFVNAIIMICVFLGALFYMYKVALEEEGNRLRELAQNQAKIIEAVSNFDYKHNLKDGLNKEEAWELTLRQFKVAHASYEGFGKTGEFTLAKQVDGKIIFLLSHRHKNLFDLQTVTLNSDLAQPMQKALKGESGVAIARDYRAEEVLAAYEPVTTPLGKLGVVAKIDLKEIQKPFINTIIYSILFLIVILLFVSIVFYKLTVPIVNKYQKNVQIIDNIFDNSSTFMVILDEKGDIVQFNSFAQKLSGYKKEEVLGKNWFSLFIPDFDKQDVQTIFNNVVNNISSDKDTVNKIILKDGTISILRWRNSTYTQGDKSYILCIGIDITDTIELESKYFQLFSSMREGFGVIDLENNIVSVNNALCEMVGYSEKELLNMKLSDITPKKWLDLEMEHIESAFKTQDCTRLYEKEYICKDGTLLPVELRVCHAKNEAGEHTGYWAIVRDISDRKEAEKELKQKDEVMLIQSRHAAMGEMISMIAHQWRQPLTIIAMNSNNILADIELDAIDNEVLKTNAMNSIAQTQELSNTIDDFKNFFQPVKAANEIYFKDLLEDIFNIIGKSLDNNNIQVNLEITFNEKINTHSRELMQVLLNLLNNAKDMMVERNIKDENRVINIIITEDKDDAVIKIKDNGGGIDAQILPRIFEPYFSTKSAKNGTGLGLYMSKTIVEKHLNGTIKAYNLTKGACFEIRIGSLEEKEDL